MSWPSGSAPSRPKTSRNAITRSSTRPSACCCARPSASPNVAEVADEAGLAKGTVYLYFPSKEELLLAVHERNIDGFFRALIALLDGDAAGRRSTTMLALTHEHMVEPPLFLPLAARCFGLMAPRHPGRDARSRSSSGWPSGCEHAGAGLERHFPDARRRAAAWRCCATATR